MPARHALILADGTVSSAAALDEVWPGWSDDVDLVIAADGGARHATDLGWLLDRWVGDGDSIGEAGLAALAAAGVPIERSPVDKDESDAELAVLAALEAGARRMTVLGALGGARVDHGIANIWLLGHPRLAGSDLRLLDASVRIRLVGPGRTDLGGRVGDLVSLFPFAGDAAGVTTAGLRFPLRNEALPSGPSRGLSNVRAAEDAFLVVGTGRILVVETPATLSS
ncbi:MAG: thiamine diphosphokinase [Candidatus Limnocylindrales bacterium]